MSDRKYLCEERLKEQSYINNIERYIQSKNLKF